MEEDIKRKKGAPRKLYTSEDAPRRVHTQLKTWIYKLVPEDRPLNNVLEELITAAFANPDQRDLAELKKKEQELEYELAKIRIEIHNREQSIERSKEIQKSIQMQRKYISFCLKKIAKMEYPSKEVTIKPEWIERLYGISFDITKMNSILKNSTLEEINTIPDMEFIEELSARKIRPGEKEKEIMEQINKDFDEEVIK